MYEDATPQGAEWEAGREAFVRVRPLPPEFARLVPDAVREAARDELHEAYARAVYRLMEANKGLDRETAETIALRICHQEVESMAVARRTAAAKELIGEYASEESQRSIEEALAKNPGREDDVWAAAGASVADALRRAAADGACGCEHGAEGGNGHGNGHGGNGNGR